jgi:preprotein translocase subunit SecG
MTANILLVIDVFAAISLIVLVLLQQGKGSDMGAAFGGGGSQSVFGSRGSANFFSRATSTLAAVFFLSSLGLAMVYTQAVEENSVTDLLQGESAAIEQTLEPAVESDVPAVPVEIDSVEAIDDGVPGLQSADEVLEEDVPAIQSVVAPDAADIEVPAVPE